MSNIKNTISKETDEQKQRYKILLNKIDNYLVYLQYNIDYKVKKKSERREKIKMIQTYLAIITAIIGFFLFFPSFKN